MADNQTDKICGKTEDKRRVGKRLIGIKEAAGYLDISVNTLYTWVSQKRIPYVKIGRLVKFDLEALDRFIESNVVEENTDWPFRTSGGGG
ncbi:MAG TPA: helix-turn-helix domain-containing protein [Candidatus Avalokitesvara rifleensis]|uniref:helix-turn-helix domain-containing protein n=1 Tax=Candidatus Avalokitesvara rifleensis TaxID=3367620 RepID=UPI002712A0C5|nr:helix-turn-helix domain-containing protein [Candidatus Brocadiales bacterium]